MDEITILLTLYSIVAGLGISRLVQGVSSMIGARDRLTFYWLHTAWLVLVFTAHVVSWFALMRFSKGAHWTVFNAIGALCMPVLLFLVSDLVVPRLDGDGRVSLKDYYFRNCRWFSGLLIAFTLLAMGVQFAVERKADWADGGFLRILALVVLVIGISSRRPAVQAFQALALLVIGVAGAAVVSVKLM